MSFSRRESDDGAFTTKTSSTTGALDDEGKEAALSSRSRPTPFLLFFFFKVPKPSVSRSSAGRSAVMAAGSPEVDANLLEELEATVDVNVDCSGNGFLVDRFEGPGRTGFPFDVASWDDAASTSLC